MGIFPRRHERRQRRLLTASLVVAAAATLPACDVADGLPGPHALPLRCEPLETVYFDYPAGIEGASTSELALPRIGASQLPRGTPILVEQDTETATWLFLLGGEITGAAWARPYGGGWLVNEVQLCRP